MHAHSPMWQGTLHRPTGEGPRIVSLVSNITELLFALRLDESIVR